MSLDLDRYMSVAEAICLLLFPHAEVVIHDFNTHRIAAIFNNFSKRKVGDESLLEITETPIMQDIYPPYYKTNWDGKKIKSVSSLLKNVTGQAIGLLCINIDVSIWEQMNQHILHFLKVETTAPDALFSDDWREKINLYVSEYLKKNGLCLESLTRSEKKKLLIELRKAGAFKTKNAALYAASVLRISRATVYNYLKEPS